MDPLTAGMIVGGTGVIGSYFQGQQSRVNARDQMDWQQMMSNTAHTREIADLKNAGLNPMLSALGNGAAVPSGAMGEAPNLGEGISAGASTALAVRDQNKNLTYKDAQIKATDASAENTTADTGKKELEKQLIEQQRLSTAQDIKSKKMQNEVDAKTINSRIKKAVADGDFAEAEKWTKILGAGASTVKDLINPLKGLLSPGKKP